MKKNSKLNKKTIVFIHIKKDINKLNNEITF